MTNVEYAVTYQAMAEWEPLPEPRFKEINWKGIPEEAALIGQQIVINDNKREIRVIGFQGGRGEVAFHEEPELQEDVFFLAGAGTMSWWDGLDCILSVNGETPLTPVLTMEEAQRAKYTLAVASYRRRGLPEFGREHLVLNIDADGKNFVVEPIITPQGHHHGTRLTEESLYFVVKHKRVI